MAHAERSPGTTRAGFALLVLGGLLCLLPFWFTFVFATHPRTAIFDTPPPLWFGASALENLRLLQERVPYWRNFGLSVYVAAATTALNLVLSAMGGYAFAMYEFRFKRTLFGVVLASMMMPAFLTMIPSFMVMQFLGWIDQPRALIVPAAAGAIGVFMMRQYMGSAIPRELIDAARMDGCGEFTIFWRVVLPLCGPALGTLGLITFIASWNNFISPLVVMRSAENYTLPLALRSMQSPNNTEWGALMAGSAIAMLPLIVVFLFSARRLVAGLTAGAVRG